MIKFYNTITSKLMLYYINALQKAMLTLQIRKLSNAFLNAQHMST